MNGDDSNEDHVNDTATSEKFKQLGFELIDIGIYESQKGIDYIKGTPIYTITDKYINYDEKYVMAKEKCIQLCKFLEDQVYNPIKENFFIIYNKSTNSISFVIKLLNDQFNERQTQIMDYVKANYENVQAFLSKNWLRLDFNNDGHVSTEDLKNDFNQMYKFLKNFEYYEKAVEIKSKLYEEAIKYMKKDLQNEKKSRESDLDENDEKINNLLNVEE